MDKLLTKEERSERGKALAIAIGKTMHENSVGLSPIDVIDSVIAATLGIILNTTTERPIVDALVLYWKMRVDESWGRVRGNVDNLAKVVADMTAAAEIKEAEKNGTVGNG